MKTLICIDRDGTLIYDDKYYLGKTNGWKKKIAFLSGVVQGIKLLKKIPDARLYMITNQPGVARKDLKLLTLERAHKVCQEILDQLADKGAALDGYFLCPHADPEYVEQKKTSFFSKLVCTCSCIKPRLGMVMDALKKEGVSLKGVKIFVLGDRASDVQTGINAGGIGVLVPFVNEDGEVEKVKGMKKSYVAKNFLDAVRFVRDNI